MRLFDVPVLSCEDWPTNGHLIEAVESLGYFAGSPVLDMTYGRGGWWTRYTPAELVAHDLYKLDGVDFRHLPHADATFGTVGFDPPYIESRDDSTGVADYLDRYGIDTGPAAFGDLWELIRAGLDEGVRVLRPGGHLLVKCMPYQSGKRFRPVPTMVTLYAEGLGVDLVDELVHRRPPGPGAWVAQRSSRRNTSTLLVFRRRRRRPRRGTTAATLQLASLVGDGRAR